MAYSGTCTDLTAGTVAFSFQSDPYVNTSIPIFILGTLTLF